MRSPPILRRPPAFSLACAMFVLAACNGCRYRTDEMDPAPSSARAPGLAGGNALSSDWRVGDAAVQSADPTIIRNASMTVDARDVRATMGETERLVAAAGGRVTRTTEYSGNASMTLRIPDPQLDATLDSIGALGKVTQRGISSDDVTAEVIDLDARVKALTTSRDRLRALHDRTNTVEEIIAVERELARVQGELDSLQGRLNQLRTDAAYSTVQLSIRREQVLGPLGVVLVGAGRLVSKLFIWR